MAIVVETQRGGGDHRVAFRATWEQYPSIARAVGRQNVRLAFDGERVEFMSPGQEHEDWKERFACLIRPIAAALGLPCKGMGSRRWEGEDTLRAIEGDATFYLTAAKITIARQRPKNSSEWPLPDLAIEIELSPSRIDRPAIYASLGVSEVWRFDGETVRIDRLGPDGIYAKAPESGWFPVRPDEITERLTIDAADDNDFSDQVLAWARKVLIPRLGRDKN